MKGTIMNLFKRTTVTAVDQTALVTRTIGRLERDIKNYPRNAELLKDELAAAYETLGRLAYDAAQIEAIPTRPAVKKTFVTVK